MGRTLRVGGQMRLIGPDERAVGRPVVTIGTFDGVHRGHQALLEAARAWAAQLSAPWVVVTFDPPPSAVLRGDAAPRLLTPLEEKLVWFERWGVPAVAVIPFTPEFARWSGDEFLDREIGGRLQAQAVVEGGTFTYGAGGLGNLDTLSAWGDRQGVSLCVVPPVQVAADGPPLSSSTIRALVADGQLDLAARALGRPYAAYAQVVPGDGRGRTIGVPTANLWLPPAKLMPPVGVYAGWAWSGEARWPAVANYGFRPTFGGDAPRLEVHLLDTNQDLYGEMLGMSLAVWIRGEQWFSSVDALVAQIGNDCALARRLWQQGRLPDPWGQPTNPP